MSFNAPGRLWLLVGVVALMSAYLLMQRRRRHYAVRFTNVAVLAAVDTPVGAGTCLRRR